MTGMTDGVIVIDKPAGWTSHDVVAKVKGALKAKKVGHLGTLDPIATGVLPLVVNRATKFAPALEGWAKQYRAVMRLGERTDTRDTEGEVVSRGDYSAVTEDEVRDAFARFTGRIEQVPPMYSSVKRGGVPLYKLARKGVEVEREPKEVEISSIEIHSFDPPDVEFTMDCSRGTYVRTLADDVGEALGCGAHLAKLRRTVSGVFTLEGAVAPTDGPGVLAGALTPLDDAVRSALSALRPVGLGPGEGKGLKNGEVVNCTDAQGFFSFLRPKEMVRFTLGGVVVAVAELIGTDVPGAGSFRVLKVLRPGIPAGDLADSGDYELRKV